MNRYTCRSISSVMALAGVVFSSGIFSTAFAANDVLDAAKQLYVNRHSGLVKEASYALRGVDRNNALSIASFPSATWFSSGTPSEVKASVAKLIGDAAAEQKIPVLVAYNVPFRDCQQYSAGGAANTAEYKAWMDGFVAGIGNGQAVVVLEPDGLGIIPHYTTINGNMEWCQPAELNAATAAADRFEQINYAVDKLAALPNTAVYLDGTHSGWLGVGDASHRLVRAGVQRADGFFLNVSNYEPTPQLEKYGTWIAKCIYYGTNTAEGGWRVGHFDWCASQYYPATPSDFSTWTLTDQWYTDNVDNAANPPTAQNLSHLVIDTSRNGRGAWTPAAGTYTDPQVWCNPPARGLGERPTTNTANALIDAKLWIKVPGESDGQCTRGTAGPVDPERGIVDPAAGKWFKEQAAELLALAKPTVAAPSCAVSYQVLGQWHGGFVTQVTVKNNSDQWVRNWHLSWAFPDGARIHNPWNADATQTRSVVNADGEFWNRHIAPGHFQSFGFIGSQNDAVHKPLLLFFLNDSVCSVR
jgi:endoglucanase